MKKPLFIPLKTEYYEAFKSGDKTEELRTYGKRWNENVCAINRGVILSKGYGAKDRINGVITNFKRQHATLLSDKHKEAIKNIYNTLDVEIACIEIEINGEPQWK